MAETRDGADDRMTKALPPADGSAPPENGAAVAQRRAAERGEGRPVRAAGDGRPEDPEAMRARIDETRARMSHTLDALEHELVRQKEDLDRKTEEVWARVTLREFRRVVSKEPWRSVAIAFVAGYIVAAIRD